MNEKARQLIEEHKRCDLFFKEALDDAIAHQHINISQEATFYVMGILLLGVKVDPHRETESMAEKYILAGYAEETEKFRRIGDLSLIVAGIWWQSLLRRLVDVDYYIHIGAYSYKKISETSSRDSNLFEELAQNFVGIVDVLTEATECISEVNLGDSNILRMYEVWLRTRNDFFAEKLRLLGINVVPGKTTRQ